jgi:hypothetical protein
VLIFLKGAVIVFFHWLAQQLERDVRIVDAAALGLVVEATWVEITKFLLADPVRISRRLSAAAQVAAVVFALLDAPAFALTADCAFRHKHVRVRVALEHTTMTAGTVPAADGEGGHVTHAP